jgi:hypothetical protein
VLTEKLTCLALIEGCRDCEIEQDYKDSVGHRCGHRSASWSTMCEVFGEARGADEDYHLLSHEPERCEDCGRIIWDKLGTNNLVSTFCPSRYCVRMGCRFCGAEYSSYGPIECPTCGTLGQLLVRTRRMHHLYRVKRRHW